MGFLVNLLLFIIAVLLFALHYKRSNRICRSKRRLDGLTCLVTGGTSGLGLEMAIDFAMRGARVIVACPFVEEGNNAQLRIKQESGNENVEFKFLDLASFQSVRLFAADIIKKEERLDILMNNAGVAGVTKKTEDGMNIIMQVNYLGHFLLTILLLPLLKKSGSPSRPSRIVNTASLMHHLAWLDVNTLADMHYNLLAQVIVYNNSKLCLLLFAREMAKKLSGSNVVINSVDPGEVGTNIFFNSYYVLGMLLYANTYYLMKIPFEGAQTPIHVAIDEKAGELSGKYYRNCKLSTTSRAAMDDELAQRVWHESVRLVNLSSDELDLLQS